MVRFSLAAKTLLSAVIVAESLAFATQSQVTTSPSPSSLQDLRTARSSSQFSRIQGIMSSSPDSSVLRIRGGGPLAASATPAVAAGAAPKPPKKVRIDSFDSIRFFLIVTIVLGHFIKFANPSDFFFKFISQQNLTVGAFFALSGYVTAYTSTENGKREPSARLVDTPKPQWILSRVFGYYPLHLITLLLFSPVFLYADLTYSGPLITAWHAFLSIFMLQCWFPTHAEIWNAPTWYLGALSVITAIVPFGLPAVAKMDKKQLRKTAFWVMLFSFLPKLGYLYDHNAWAISESIINPKVHPNMAIFNLQRFNPLLMAGEVFLGAIACRLVMLDDDPDEKEKRVKTNALSTIVPILGLIGISLLRGLDLLVCSDFLARYLFFTPVFVRLLMALHRNTVSGVTDPMRTILSHPVLVWLGNLAFPIYIVHGPVGQIFFKKLIASKVFGKVLSGPTNFGLYLAATATTALILQKTVLQNKAINDWSKSTVDQLSKWF